MDPRTTATVMGIIRAGVGASLVAAPGWAGRIWVGNDADGPGTKVIARALGARDVVLGGAILLAGTSGDPARATRYVRHGVAADAADVAATLIAARHLEGNRRIVMPIVAAAVGAMGLLAASLDPTDTAKRSEESTAGPGSDEIDDHAEIVDQQGAVLEEMVAAGVRTSIIVEP